MTKVHARAASEAGQRERKPMDQAGWKRLKEMAKTEAERFSFETVIESLEAACREHLPQFEMPPAHNSENGPSVRPEPGSDGWYAQRISIAIDSVRRFLAAGLGSSAAAEAVGLGVLAGDWPPAQKWRKLQEQRKAAGKKGGSLKTATSDELEEKVEALAIKIRKNHPHSTGRTHSTRWLAREIAKELGKPEGTVRGHLRRLKQK